MSKSLRIQLNERMQKWFPDREFFMRSQGQVKFLKISSTLQKRVAGVAAFAFAAWIVVTCWMVVGQIWVNHDRAAIAAREAKAMTSEHRVAAYRSSLDEVTEDLERRQEFLENVVESHFDQSGSRAAKAQATEAEKTVRKISAMIPEARGLATVESRQIALVEHLTRLADARSVQAESAIRKLGLNPSSMMVSAKSEGVGGPFLPFFAGKEETRLDPRFKSLEASLDRMTALERGLDTIPSTVPADLRFVRRLSSGFGYRRDPMTGRGALHSGLDFSGARGAPILAAASGKVSFAGRKSGYGRCIEISHGNGLMTRYAHLSAVKVHVGQKVESGGAIGKMGNSGRSTGTHLHFEVRINGRAVNPRPFLEASGNVLTNQIAQRGKGNAADAS